MRKLFVVISGQIVRENSSNLMNFWRGFINIQRAIYGVDSVKIVSHSWNPEFDDLVKRVYGADLVSSEVQGCFAEEFMPLIKPVSRFEKGIVRSRSTWSAVTPQSILGNLKSKSKAIRLLEGLDIKEKDQVLSVRWDQGCTGSESVNRIIFDTSLDARYHYMSYYSAIDEGYADMWFISPYQFAKKFRDIDKYALDAIAGKNSYFDDFTKNGWPLSMQISQTQGLVNRCRRAIFNKIALVFNLSICKRLSPVFANTARVEATRRIDQIAFSGENSLTEDEKTRVVFPSYQALNIHAILKSFVISSGLRKNSRFLSLQDFQHSHNGTMINAIECACIVYEDLLSSGVWMETINRLLRYLPSNCKVLYLVANSSKDLLGLCDRFGDDIEIVLLTHEEHEEHADRLRDAFSVIGERFDIAYFMCTSTPLFNCVDQVYFNALLHYMNNSNEYYISLLDVDNVHKKERHESFPKLVKNYGGGSFSVKASIIKPKFLHRFFKNLEGDICNIEQACAESNFIFSAVEGSSVIGKGLMTSSSFPHAFLEQQVV